MMTRCYIFTGMVINGFVSVSLSTLEKRFDLTSSTTGAIASTYDIGSLVTVMHQRMISDRL